ncbi:AAA family ATPase [Pseudoxanthomonas suwonensis]|uniref:Rad50/SbcC-type AAA domain-containing protein n=1 Tax=Pseudoxanthomonas suwonensis TaxID=314722 RepID=A0A0E3ULL2_9GAMM|nr:AAA family ATPase [Pseudoxanthomonas suwonensis]AKC85561.1 hypothetical protein WQ53_01045 [Pseudoxanthomonas suwonensis]
MRLSFVEVAGFRGFRNKVRLDLPDGFAVLTGRNGAGKSTILDAVDFALTGTLSKYEVKGAKGGGLDEHIWWVGEGAAAEQFVRIGFTDKEGRELSVTRSRERGLEQPLEEVGGWICGDNLPSPSWPDVFLKTSLIRDETIAALSLDLPEQARFASVRGAIGGMTGQDHSERIASLVRAASAAKEAQEKRVNDLQAELGRTLSALTEARSIAERQEDTAAASQLIALVAPDIAGSTAQRAEELRKRLAKRRLDNNNLTESLALAEQLAREIIEARSEDAQGRVKAATDALSLAERTSEQAVSRLAAAEERLEKERSNNDFVSQMVSLLSHGEAIGLQDDHCPLCAANRTQDEFNAAIAAARARLDEAGARAAAAEDEWKVAKIEAEKANLEHVSAQATVSTMTAKHARDEERFASLQALFASHNLQLAIDDINSVRSALLVHREQTAQLERAVYTLESSTAQDRVSSLEANAAKLRALIDDESIKLSSINSTFESTRQIDSASKTVVNQILAEQFDTVLPLLKELYKRLRPHADWREIETDFGGRVRASLNFTVGDGRNPQFLFSSGQRRAAGLAFLLAIHLSRPWCRLRTLMMDDPIQHIDDYRALNMVEVLSAIRRTGRQVIVAVEDSALADVLCRRLRSSTLQTGMLFELKTDSTGSAEIGETRTIYPLPREVLKVAQAS